jgi:hypothetical protein
MPDGLQEGEIGQKLQARAEACEEVAGELESAAGEINTSIFDDAKDTLVSEVDGRLAELVKRAKASKQRWAEDAGKLQVQTEPFNDDTGDPVKLSLATIRSVIVHWSFFDPTFKIDVAEDQEFLVELCKWLETAYEEMLDTVRSEVQDKINEVSWEIDPC